MEEENALKRQLQWWRGLEWQRRREVGGGKEFDWVWPQCQQDLLMD